MIRLGSRRLGEFAIVFLGVTFLILACVYALPGDPIAALGGSKPLSPAVVAQLRAEHHLDEPLWRQYLLYLGGVVTGDLGTSFSGRPVAEMMAERWPTTIALALTTWVLEVVGGVILGVVAGLRRGKLIDRSILLITVLVPAIPIFVLAVFARLVFGVRLGIFPVAGDAAGWPMAYLLPAAVTAIAGLAAVVRLTRASVSETLLSDFIRTHRAKGFSPRRIVGVHVSKNAALPVLTLVGVSFGALLAGTVFVESVFNLPGIGQLLVNAIASHDGALVVGIATALVLVFLVTNLLVDLLATVLDPRMRRG